MEGGSYLGRLGGASLSPKRLEDGYCGAMHWHLPESPQSQKKLLLFE